MRVEEFINKLVFVYGDFYTEGMAREVANIVSKLNPKQREKLMTVYLRQVPGNFRPDVKNINYCIELAGINPNEREHRCRACNNVWTYNDTMCPRCGFDMNSSEDPAVYHYEWETQTGRFCKEDIQEIINNMKFRRV